MAEWLRRAIVVSVAGASMLAPACSSTRTIDSAKLEGKVKDFVTGLGDQVVAATCPDTIPVKTGYTFDCTVKTPAGVNGTVKVTETDDQGNVNVQFLG